MTYFKDAAERKAQQKKHCVACVDKWNGGFGINEKAAHGIFKRRLSSSSAAYTYIFHTPAD
jgi:hypothetical protein